MAFCGRCCLAFSYLFCADICWLGDILEYLVYKEVMSPLATTETNKSVSKFVASIEDESKREDVKTLVKMIQKITKKKPKIWGENFMIGFGKYKYKRKGGKEEFEWFNVVFAPRKTNIKLYLTFDISKQKVQALVASGKAGVADYFQRKATVSPGKQG